MDLSLWRRLFGGGAAPPPMSGGSGGDSPMLWAAHPSHLSGAPRRIAIFTIGSLARIAVTLLNSSHVHNADTLLHLVTARPPGTPLITVSNHTSTLDDPLMWAFKGFPVTNARLSRWILAAEDICFTNPLFSYFFRVGKCIPIRRGAGIYQPFMDEALDRINEGEWMHTFPEGKVCQEHGPLRRFKWGVGSLVARAAVPPIVLPIGHTGFDQVMPEKYMFGRRPLLPLAGKKITIVVGEPMEFDMASLRDTAMKFSASSPSPFPLSCNAFKMDLAARRPGPKHLVALDDNSLGWLYSHITQQIQAAVEELRWQALGKNRQSS
ncbi:N-acylphosphatidylethanolamine synthase [Selaginella moellendorffii]|uniref:N-acylphosphatidylethanolamine synthase n=1 Tax=Selaginella moellendorffii TaxID=88036 RepID=UPI000D1CF14F|nr:N-acylphosphatidylethanolamine synthase [Selaginella moellendorffii]|eukprot:XP_024536046.1 N-acylphosphatidylethanolamine synthase [Selaginella moellendorffii]